MESNPQDRQEIPATLREIRDGQREMIRLLTAQQAPAEKQQERSRGP